MAQRSRRSAPAPGLRDVARVAGVSVASASVALNGRAGVADDTRARVMAVADRLGYRANPQAQALRRGRTSTYALVIRNFANPFFLDVLSGAEEVAAGAGATLIVADSQYSLEVEQTHVRDMAGRQCAGLAIAPVGSGDSIRLWQQLRPGLPAVALNASVPDLSRVTRVSPDNVDAVTAPLQRLADLGHIRVAFLTAPSTLMADSDRLATFRRAGRRLGLSLRTLSSPLTLEAVEAATRRLLSQPDAPTALIANSDYTAHGMYRAARALGLVVGTDVSVVGHDDLPTSELLDPPLATVRVDRRALGRAVMERLLDPGRRDDHFEPVELVERASMGRPRRASRATRA